MKSKIFFASLLLSLSFASLAAANNFKMCSPENLPHTTSEERAELMALVFKKSAASSTPTNIVYDWFVKKYLLTTKPSGEVSLMDVCEMSEKNLDHIAYYDVCYTNQFCDVSWRAYKKSL